MSKYSVKSLWNIIYPNMSEVYDYAGRRMLKCAIGDQNSSYCPTIDHIRPLSAGGKDGLENIVLCSILTNEEKADSFPTWCANGSCFQAKRVPGKINEYDIYKL